eukprot:s1127_g1.t1
MATTSQSYLCITIAPRHLSMESGFGSCSKADEHDKVEAAMHEARKAFDKSQLLLDTAIDGAEKASAEAKAAADQAKILEEEHGHLVMSLFVQTCLGHLGQQE